jgi:hypothetical protein
VCSLGLDYGTHGGGDHIASSSKQTIRNAR